MLCCVVLCCVVLCCVVLCCVVLCCVVLCCVVLCCVVLCKFGDTEYPLTLLPTAFYDFLSYWGGIFISHPRKQCYNYLIDLKFGTYNKWHKTIKNANFQNIYSSIFRDMTL